MPTRKSLEPILRCAGEEGTIDTTNHVIKKMCTFAWIIKNTADALDIDPSFDEFHARLTEIYLMAYDKIAIEDARLKADNGYQPGPSSVPNLFGKPK
jgi:hypothetical protein